MVILEFSKNQKKYFKQLFYTTAKGRLLVIYCIKLSTLYFELELLTFQLINIMY